MFTLTITASQITSTDTNFNINNLSYGNDFKPYKVVFVDNTGKEIQRQRQKFEKKMTNQTLPKLAFQIYEDKISQLTQSDKIAFPICRYSPLNSMICGIFCSLPEFKAYKNTIEYLMYKNEATKNVFVIYCWNIFSTLYFVQECLKRFGNKGDKFVLEYDFKKSKSKVVNSSDNVVAADTAYEASEFSKNTILYGPPGTGKTYNTAIYAVAICDNKTKAEIEKMDYDDVCDRYDQLIQEERIEFTTFHQSYGYEDFIEGIKPTVELVNGKEDTCYRVTDGRFKKFCERTESIEFFEAWEKLIEYVQNDPNGYIEVKRDKVTKKLKWDDVNQKFYDTKASLKYQYADYDSVRKAYTGALEKGQNSGSKAQIYYNSMAVLKTMADKFGLGESKVDYSPKVFIIDEINRGNISKIFGELITLIEDDKREQAYVTLPYSGDLFTVPENVYILGTMNTADRSIALMDTALRRRFNFVEMMPDSDVFVKKNEDGTIKEQVIIDGVNIKSLLDEINNRIEYLYDREHTIGHAYFKKFIDGDGTADDLKKVFKNTIIPLLQEYFYDDYEKISLVLGDNKFKKDREYRFVIEKNVPKAFERSSYDEGVKYNMNQDIWKLAPGDFAIRLKAIYEEDNGTSSDETEGEIA